MSINQRNGWSKIAAARARVDEAEVTLDVLFVDGDEAVACEPTVNHRLMTKEALIAEARSERHQATLFPNKPRCPICCETHLMQEKFAKDR